MANPYQELNSLLVSELHRHITNDTDNGLRLKKLDRGYLEGIILRDEAYLEYLLEVYTMIGEHVKKRTLPFYFSQWSSLLAELGINYILITEATITSLNRINQKSKEQQYIELDDFRELFFLIIIAHDYQQKT